jgi:hypothetical protein
VAQKPAVATAPVYGHASDYSWLRGQVEYSRLGKGWRLRFASVDEEDHHGGSVTLCENQDLAHLEDGQYVFVQGHLSKPADRGTSPAYRVDTLKVLDSGR